MYKLSELPTSRCLGCGSLMKEHYTPSGREPEYKCVAYRENECRRIVQIGEIKIRKGEQFTINSSYARWFDRIEVPEDVVVPVYGYLGSDGKIDNFPLVNWSVDGLVVASDWSPCLAGRPIADGRNKNLGEKRRYVHSRYAYEVAEAIEQGTEGPETGIVLGPGWVAKDGKIFLSV